MTVDHNASKPTGLPPHQQLAAPGKWPVVGERAPAPCAGAWRVSVAGLVGRPRTWTLEELKALPAVEQAVDIHCVTRWSKLGVRFGGIPLRRLLEPCGPRPEAQFVSFVAHSSRRHSTSLLLADALGLETLVALTCEGQPLPEIHGGPVRIIVPGRYFYKSLKWLEAIELLAEDRLGFWESQAGYHNRADPWREERYLAPTLDRQQARELLARRSVAGLELRGLEARGRDLRSLDARGALLRDAHFEQARLDGACFDGANLSNAHLEGAGLTGATFRRADLEGANFRAADLSGTDLQGASLFGATFCPEAGDTDGWGPARLDSATRIDAAALDQLTPIQQAFVRAARPG